MYEHLFFECKFVRSLWNKIEQEIFSKLDISLTEKKIYLGIPNSYLPNQIINIVKQSIVNSRHRNTIPTLKNAFRQIYKIYEIEHHQSLFNKCEDDFENKWKDLHDILK